MKVFHSGRNRGAVENRALVWRWRSCQCGEGRQPAATNGWSRHWMSERRAPAELHGLCKTGTKQKAAAEFESLGGGSREDSRHGCDACSCRATTAPCGSETAREGKDTARTIRIKGWRLGVYSITTRESETGIPDQYHGGGLKHETKNESVCLRMYFLGLGHGRSGLWANHVCNDNRYGH